MKKSVKMLFSMLIVASLPFPAMAASDATSTETSQVIQASATVDSVDAPNRQFTIRDKSGALQTIEVPPEVKNLAQLKKGDKVIVRYRVALAAEIKKPGAGTKGIETKESIERAAPGEKPGGMLQRQTKATIKVKAVDTGKNTLTFVGPKGNTRTVAVNDLELRAYLRKLKPGDELEVVYTEAMAVDVQPAR
jgi:Cu/Ag efflux protein CusF